MKSVSKFASLSGWSCFWEEGVSVREVIASRVTTSASEPDSSSVVGQQEMFSPAGVRGSTGWWWWRCDVGGDGPEITRLLHGAPSQPRRPGKGFIANTRRAFLHTRSHHTQTHTQKSTNAYT